MNKNEEPTVLTDEDYYDLIELLYTSLNHVDFTDYDTWNGKNIEQIANELQLEVKTEQTNSSEYTVIYDCLGTFIISENFGLRFYPTSTSHYAYVCSKYMYYYQYCRALNSFISEYFFGDVC